MVSLSPRAILNWQRTASTASSACFGPVERDGLQGDARADAVTAYMKEFLPTDDLLFLMRLRVESTRLRLGLRASEQHAAASEADRDDRSCRRGIVGER